MFLDNQPILHVIDATTRFGAARWVKSMSARDTWDALRACWIDVYIRPPDMIVHDAGKNFASDEFRQHATSMAISTKEVPIESHNSVGVVERYHAPLRRAYEIIRDEINNVPKDVMLQMAVKAVNDMAAASDPPHPTISQRAMAIKAAMKEVRRCHESRRVADALRTRNGPEVSSTHNLPLGSEVMAWREKEKWTGPHKFLGMTGESCKIEMPYGPASFRSIVVKPYFSENQEHSQNNNNNKENNENNGNTDPPESQTRRYPIRVRNPTERARESYFANENSNSIFINSKEKIDIELSHQLRAKGIIKTPGPPFENSRKQEIDGLIARGVFELISWDRKLLDSVKIFKSRFVDEIKGKGTATPYEKSRLVIQAYHDDEKVEILTQAPTIQRASQRLIMALAPSLSDSCRIYIRDISQAYIQSTTKLNRLILAKPPKEIAMSINQNTLMRLIKPLYGIPEAGTHWFKTYHKHHTEKLSLETSIFDPCLLITNSVTKSFGIVGMQTDDTLFLGDEEFAKSENEELIKASFKAKPVETLSQETPLIFNGGKLIKDVRNIIFIQKGQGSRIELVDPKSSSYRQDFLVQRARGAYLSTICQPEAAFDLSVAAQHQNPSAENIDQLNKYLKWQKENFNRGIRFIPLKLKHAKLFTFVDGSFANNKDLSSQIGFVIVLANESMEKDEFKICGNILHWSSIKCRRVTRSVLASELYAMVHGTDIAIAISTTLKMITTKLQIEEIPIVLCTDSFSLYECMVKLGTTKEKRLMIDIMAIRQSYERRESSEIRWINGCDNPADSMTKANPSRALQQLIDSSNLNIRVEGWVQRPDKGDRDVLKRKKKERKLPVSGRDL
ncbi:hypothetical protein K3495_g11268 [Podosphaera aphanis]|nr:hypothetical protein K3495_g11268 [Podosphaera aphanis]